RFRRRVDGAFHLRGVGDVGSVRRRLATGLADLAGHALGDVFLRAIDDGDVGAGLAERLRHALADAAAAAEDDGRALPELVLAHAHSRAGIRRTLAAARRREPHP